MQGDHPGCAAKCWLRCSGRVEEERCSMKTPHIHRLASLASTAPDIAAAGHMTYLTHARVPSGFSRHWWLPSQFPCTEYTAALLVRGVQMHGVQTVAFIMCSSAEIISDINHAITSTQHRPGTSRHSARITQILSENMLREALKIRYLKLFTLRVR